MQVSTIGLDLAKNVFQVHGVDLAGGIVLKKQLRRGQLIAFFEKLSPCLVGMEACATAHHWARELRTLGHDVRLIPPSYVKAYVKRGKNDAADAAAICEAVGRPSMRFVPVKTAEQQTALMLHRTRDLLIRQRTQLINALRAHLAELGMVAAQGRDGVKALIGLVSDESNGQLPELARTALRPLVAQFAALAQEIGTLDRRLHAEHRASDASRRLEAIPGIGVINATAITATVTDPKVFRSGREFAAWIGLVPRQNSTGGKERLGSISKKGDRYLRRLFIPDQVRDLCDGGLAPRARPSREASLAHAALGATPRQGGGGRARQQDGADRLGRAGQGRDLSSAGARGGGVK